MTAPTICAAPGCAELEPCPRHGAADAARQPTRAPELCSAPGCDSLRPCTAHPTHEGWPGHGRSAQHKAHRRELWNDGPPPCALCGEPADVLDHVVPLAEGGEDERANRVPLCARCSEDKTQAEAMRGRARAKALRTE